MHSGRVRNDRDILSIYFSESKLMIARRYAKFFALHMEEIHCDQWLSHPERASDSPAING